MIVKGEKNESKEKTDHQSRRTRLHKLIEKKHNDKEESL